jgi:hypothetical protein
VKLFLVDEGGARLSLEGRAAEIAFALRMIQDDVNRHECGSVEVHFKHDDLTLDVTRPRRLPQEEQYEVVESLALWARAC